MSEQTSFSWFSQAFRKGVDEYYGRGVRIEKSIKYSKAHNDSAITRTMDKIPMYVRYIEKEYDIEVFEKTKKHGARNCRVRCA